MIRIVKYTFMNAPWALMTSLSSGLANYVVILILSAAFGLAAAGQFRLFLSIVGMLSIFTLMDSGKIAVKYLVLQAKGVVKPLLLARMRWALLGTLAGLVTAAVFQRHGNDLWVPVMVASLLLPLTYPTDIFEQINQARQQFRINAVYNCTKYVVLVLLAFPAVWLGTGPIIYLVVYSVVLTAFNAYFVTRHQETFEAPDRNAGTYVSEGLKLSGSGLFPLILENADKFLISYFFGLEALGLYTVGVSTGRLLVRFVKPVLTIYFPLLVEQRPPRRVLVICLVALTAVGLMGTVPVQYYFDHVLGRELAEGYPLAAVVLLGLGLHAASVIVQYSSIYYKDSTIAVPTIANIATSLVVIAYLVSAVTSGGHYALMLCAASYPLRDFLIMVTTMILSKRAVEYEKIGSVS